MNCVKKCQRCSECMNFIPKEQNWEPVLPENINGLTVGMELKHISSDCRFIIVGLYDDYSNCRWISEYKIKVKYFVKELNLYVYIWLPIYDLMYKPE